MCYSGIIRIDEIKGFGILLQISYLKVWHAFVYGLFEFVLCGSTFGCKLELDIFRLYLYQLCIFKDWKKKQLMLCQWWWIIYEHYFFSIRKRSILWRGHSNMWMSFDLNDSFIAGATCLGCSLNGGWFSQAFLPQAFLKTFFQDCSVFGSINLPINSDQLSCQQNCSHGEARWWQYHDVSH